MDNQELAKELLGYTYIDIQKIPEIYKLFEIDVDKFKEEHEEADYESALFTLMDSKAANVIFRFLMNPFNRLKKLS